MTDAAVTEIARYSRLAAAREGALALAAKDLDYTLTRDGAEWVIRTELDVSETAIAEIALFDAEMRERASAPRPRVIGGVQPVSIFVAGWIMSGFFLAQQKLGPGWTDRGAATGRIWAEGEIWRCVTALTLHGDLSHFLANLAVGLLFAVFLVPQFGAGLGWLLILASGAIGNALNAWGYRGEDHSSIGASTAVFGALGLLTAAEFVALWGAPATRNRWQLILPIGAGLSLLAYLGSGDGQPHIDFMAHGWGFAAGLALGGAAAGFRIRERLPRAAQHMCALSTLAILAWAWRAASVHV